MADKGRGPRLLAVMVVFVLVAAWSPSTLAQQRRLIRLDVTGSDAVTQAVKHYLTDPGGLRFLLGDDAAIPVLAVAARETSEGSRLNSKVTLHIDRMELLRPDGTVDYASLDWTAYDTGEVQAARRNAIGLLGQYLAEDEELREALTQIPAQHFYTVRRPASRSDDAQALAGIKAEILSRLSERITAAHADLAERIDAMEAASGASGLNDGETQRTQAQLAALARRQEDFQQRLETLARSLQTGTGVYSEAALETLQAGLERNFRAREAPFVVRGGCPPPPGVDFKSLFAAVIQVPGAGPGDLGSGLYRIYADNQCLVYAQGPDQAGPKVAASFSRLEHGPMRTTFRAPRFYLRLTAQSYFPDDRTVVLSRCDAEALLRANTQGNQPGRIFRDGLIYLIPQGREDDGA